MSIVNQFNKLHGKRVYRSTLQKLLEKAKLLKVFEVSSRLEKALQLNKEKSFIIEIENPIQTLGLNAVENNDAWLPKYLQFKNKPKEAIKHLLKVKKGDCINALYRKDVGFIDIVWGENDAKNKGFGLKHIYEKHGKEIEQLGFKIEDFLPIIVQYGDFKLTDNINKIELSGEMFKIIISKKAYINGKKEKKVFVLSAFDLRPLWKKQKSSGLNGTYDGINFTKKPLLSSTLDKNLIEKSSFKITKSNNSEPIYRKENIIKCDLHNNHNKNNTKNELNAQSKKKSSIEITESFAQNKKTIEKPTAVKPALAIVNKNSLAYKMANKPENFEYFIIEDKNFRKLLGQIEIKPKESVFISLTGGEGSMKTRMAFQFMNCFAQNYKVGHASIEEHPESSLYYDTAEEYLNAKALSNIDNPEVKSLSDLHKLIQDNDVIVIDSFTKMKEIEKSFEVDKDLRKKYDGKLFIVIFQQTTKGSMRGGSKSQFDADIVLFTEKYEDYTKNYVYATKHRYNKEIGLKFNIFNKQLVGTAPGVKKLSFTVN